MYIPYPPSSYSGITSMIHMKLGDKRFAKTVSKWTELKTFFYLFLGQSVPKLGEETKGLQLFQPLG